MRIFTFFHQPIITPEEDDLPLPSIDSLPPPYIEPPSEPSFLPPPPEDDLVPSEGLLPVALPGVPDNL